MTGERAGAGSDHGSQVVVAASGRTSLLIALALVLAVTAAYLPTLGAEFLNWDDNVKVTDNPHVQTLSWETVRWALTSDRAGYAMPLTWLSHALDVRLHGLDPRGHHATSVALHAANTVLVFLALRALTGALWPSAMVAALFGLHPLRVEAVAWVAERKEILSAFFTLLALLAYARAVRGRTPASALAVAAAFVAALSSKPMAITLPALLVLLDYWPLRRLSWRTVGEKIPLVVLAVACALWALVGSAAAGAMRSGEAIAFTDRLANAVVAYARYLGLVLWPVGLSPWYSHPALDGEPLAAETVAAAAAVLVAVSVAVVLARRRRPHLLVGWLWYLGTLVPVTGVVQVGDQAMADRYVYVPLVGIFLAAVFEVAGWRVWRRDGARRAAVVLAVGVLATLAVLTWRQTHVWHDSTTFWAYTLAVNPRAAVGYYAQGAMASSEGRVDDAIRAYRLALKLRPEWANAHTEAGNLLARQGRLAAAASHYRRALAVRPEGLENRNNLANVLMSMGRIADARRELETAIRLRPRFAEAHNNLGILLAREGELMAAVRHFQAALAAEPDFVPARRNLAAVLGALAEPETADDGDGAR